MQNTSSVPRSFRIRGFVAAAVLLLLTGFNLVAAHYLSDAMAQGQSTMQSQPYGENGEPVQSPDDNPQWVTFSRQMKLINFSLVANAILMIGAAIGVSLWRGRLWVLTALAVTVILQGLATHEANLRQVPAVPSVEAILVWYIVVLVPLLWPYIVRRRQPDALRASA